MNASGLGRNQLKKLLKITVLFSAIWNLLILLCTPVVLRFYSLDGQAKRLVFWLVLLHNVFNAVAFPFSSALSNGLRAAGDVKFTMGASIFTTVAVRLVLSYVFAITLNLGVMGIAWAMRPDWIVRGAVNYLRLKAENGSSLR